MAKRTTNHRRRERLDDDATVETGVNGDDARDSRGRFGRGNSFASGNGARQRAAELRRAMLEALAPRLPEVIEAVLRKAASGDMVATKLAFSYGFGLPRPGDDESIAAIADRVAELVSRTTKIEPRPDADDPSDPDLIQDAAALTELGVPVANLPYALGISAETFSEWAKHARDVAGSDAKPLMAAIDLAATRHSLRCSLLAERSPMQLLERRYPDHFNRVAPRQPEADPEQYDESDEFA
ncbi:MAG: hypothetical protein AAF328_01160 [Planctomycetota bacterium]